MTQQKTSDEIALLEQAVAHTRKYVAGAKPNQMNDSTPCDKWNVKQLLDHISGAATYGIGVLGGAQASGEAHDAAKAGTTVEAYDKATKQLVAAAKQPGALQKMVKGPTGEMAGGKFLSIITNDVLIHGWDLAKATKQDTKLPANLVETIYAAMSPGFANLSKSPAFKPVVSVAANASLQDKLIAGLGRKP